MFNETYKLQHHNTKIILYAVQMLFTYLLGVLPFLLFVHIIVLLKIDS
jgi:hypothetical protein